MQSCKQFNHTVTAIGNRYELMCAVYRFNTCNLRSINFIASNSEVLKQYKHSTRLSRSSFRSLEDQESTSDVATSLGPWRRPINASLILQGVEVSVNVVSVSGPLGGGPVGWMTVWVWVFGGKPMKSPLPTAGARQSTPLDTGSDRGILTLMKGWTGSTRPPTATPLDGGGRSGSLAEWGKMTEQEDVL